MNSPLPLQLIGFCLIGFLLLATGCGSNEETNEPNTIAAVASDTEEASKSLENPDKTTSSDSPEAVPGGADQDAQAGDPPNQGKAPQEDTPNARSGNPQSMYSAHAFRDAALNGKMSVIESVLKSNMNVNAADENGTTAFAMAAHGGHLEIVKLLIKNGAEFDRPDSKGITPIAMAAFNGHTEIVKLLLKLGSKADAPDVQGNTPLVHAAGGNFPGTVQVLIDAGADVNVRFGDERWTPLMIAAAEGGLESVQTLLKAGADKTVKDTDGDTALEFAKEKGHQELVELLSK